MSKIDNDLAKSEIECVTSGSTCCLALIQGQDSIPDQVKQPIDPSQPPKSKSPFVPKSQVALPSPHIIFSNTGDSRALLLQFSDPGEEGKQSAGAGYRLESVHATVDHTCKLDHERRRILQHGGRVDQISAGIGRLGFS